MESMLEENKKRGNRKVRKGLVVSNKMQKTVVVKVERTIRHPQYGKVVTRAKKYYAHHEGEPLAIGSEVTIRRNTPSIEAQALACGRIRYLIRRILKAEFKSYDSTRNPAQSGR